MSDRASDNALNRRTALLKSAAFLAATVHAGSPAAARAKPGGRIRYIDIHTHLGAFVAGKEFTAEALVEFMNRNDVERSVVLPLVSPESAPIPQPTQTALDAFKKFPDRIIPFCGVDPRCVTVPPQRTGHVGGVQGLVDILKRYQDAGCRGLGEHKTGLLFDAP